MEIFIYMIIGFVIGGAFYVVLSAFKSIKARNPKRNKRKPQKVYMETFAEDYEEDD